MFNYHFDELVIVDNRFSNTTKDAVVYCAKCDNDNNGYRFTDCFTISEVNVPEKCELYPTSLNNYGLKCSKTVKQFNVDPRNEDLASIGGCVYSKDGTQFIKYPNGREENTFYINGPVKELGDYSFRGSNLENLYIGSNVEKIGDGALESCYSLKRLYIASPKLKMREKIFWKSPYVDENSFKLTVGAAKGSKAEEFCRELGIRFMVVEESEVEKFFNMSDEEVFSITDYQYSTTGVTTYNMSNYGYNMSLFQYDYLTIEVPYNITIEHLSIDGSSLAQIPSRVRSKIKHLEISGSINSVDSMRLEMLENLESITIGCQVSHVNFNQISGAPKLQKINIEYGHNAYRIFNDCIYSHDMKELIWYNPCLTAKVHEVVGTVEKIHSKAFAGATHLEAIRLSDNMIELADEAFAGAYELKKVYFGVQIKKIGKDIFGVNSTDIKRPWRHHRRVEIASTSESVLEQIPSDSNVINKIIKDNEVYDFLLSEPEWEYYCS